MEDVLEVKLNPKEIATWVQALRSGEYEQGHGKLCQVEDDGVCYCCLGVLADVMGLDPEVINEHVHLDGIERSDWLGPWSRGGEGTFDVSDPATHTTLQRMLAGLNDGGWSFEQIAGWVEARLWKREWGALDSVLDGYWEKQAQIADYAWQHSEGLFQGCYMLGGPLSGEVRLAILAYLQNPTQNGWSDIRWLRIAGPTTLWEAWCALDPVAPRTGSWSFPSGAVLRTAIRAAAIARQQRIQQGLHDELTQRMN